MLLDLISPSQQCYFNIKLAHLLGLHTAIYLSEILSINEKAVRKGRCVEGSYIVDRDYIESRTTLTPDEQLNIDAKLKSLGILDFADNIPNQLTLNITMLTTMLMEDNERLRSTVDEVNRVISKAPKKDKRQSIFYALKRGLDCSNDELRTALCDWIDGVAANPRGFLTKKTVNIFREKVDEFAQHNLDVALGVIQIATVHGYADATWAIKKYKETFGTPKAYVAPAPVCLSVSDEVF